MEAVVNGTGNTAAMVVTTSPMDFFSMVQHIEKCIGAKTLDILRARNWVGSLTDSDWQLAEELVLDPVEVTPSIRMDGLLFRVPVRGYGAQDIRLHVEGDLLCICGCETSAQARPRMFYTRVKLPASTAGYRCSAWIAHSVLHVSVSLEPGSTAAATVPFRAALPADAGYATAV